MAVKKIAQTKSSKQRYFGTKQAASLLGITPNKLKSILVMVDDGELGVHVFNEKPGSKRLHRRFTRKSIRRLKAILRLKDCGVKYVEMNTLMISRAAKNAGIKVYQGQGEQRPARPTTLG